MAWARLELELKTLQATTQAAGKVSQERQAQEVKHLQWALTLAAVSYTHLDVYKRQTYTFLAHQIAITFN